MSVVSKINPVGIDKPIDIIQNALFDGLVTNGSFVDYTVYPRVYINESKNGIKPENYTSKNEYKDVFVDDGHALSSFVIVDPTRDSTTTTNFTPNISIIFQARLDKLITGITHRPDEEFNNQVAVILNRLRSRGIILEGLVTGLENVYAEFDTTSVKWDDMNPFYVVRFNLTVSNSYDCALVLQAPTTSPLGKPIYWGVDANPSINTTVEILTLNSEFSTDRLITKTFNPDNESGEYIYFAIPVAYGTPTFKYNNFTITFMETIVPTDVFISEDYGVYRSNQLQHGQNLIFEMQ